MMTLHGVRDGGEVVGDEEGERVSDGTKIGGPWIGRFNGGWWT